MEEAHYEDLLATSIEITQVGTLLESTRRRIYQTIGWEYEPQKPTWEIKRVDILCAMLSSTCEWCHHAHVEITRDKYLMWKELLPVWCEHGGLLRSITVDPEEHSQEVKRGTMPSRVERVLLLANTASVKPGGDLISLRELVRKQSTDTAHHLKATAQVGEYLPPTDLFPELEVEYVWTKMSVLKKLAKELEDMLYEQMSVQKALGTVLGVEGARMEEDNLSSKSMNMQPEEEMKGLERKILHAPIWGSQEEGRRQIAMRILDQEATGKKASYKVCLSRGTPLHVNSPLH